MKIIMLGAPGAGKGTQAIKIADKYGIPHISTGDLFRSNIGNNTELGREAKQYMDAGKLVPDELTVRMLFDRVSNEDCKNGYVLDGFPRTISQAEVLEEEVGKRDDRIDFAINVDVPDDHIIRRMSGRRACPKCGATYHIEHVPPKKEGICDSCGEQLILRNDDAPETVQKRLDVYHEQTQPLIDFYDKRKILRTVDGTKDLQDVFGEIVKILGD
ncbi:MAG: adenylate kinase [Lachnospiraceae bacterium]|nr:adenylate kinase [Lachnospiraceae bacterium]